MRCGSSICDDSSMMARSKCFIFSRWMLALSADVVAQNTRVLAISSLTARALRQSLARLHSRWSLNALSQLSSEPMRRKSMQLSTSLLQISSTARLVYDSRTTLAAGLVSSSFRMLSSPNDVLPVPGGPMTRKMSRACLARATSVLNEP